MINFQFEVQTESGKRLSKVIKAHDIDSAYDQIYDMYPNSYIELI
jgi:hypothetical protein